MPPPRNRNQHRPAHRDERDPRLRFNDATGRPVVTLVHATYDTVAVGVVPVVGTGVPLIAFGLSAGLTALVALGVIAVHPGSRHSERGLPPRLRNSRMIARV